MRLKRKIPRLAEATEWIKRALPAAAITLMPLTAHAQVAGGTSGGWMAIAQTVATFIETGFGATLVVVAVAIAGARAAFHGHWGHFWSAVGGGAVVITAAWIVTTFLGGTVAGVGGG